MFPRLPSASVLGLALVAASAPTPAAPPLPERPNVVYIMADELGYYEPGFMGGKTLRTPVLDRFAAEGMVFRNLLAGSSVCAPTRCTLLTGRHSGHSSVRTNGGGTPLRADEQTIASLLKPRGYATGGFGKWGCGGRDSTGVPEKHGFDVFFGYYDQVHAHTYYPPYLIRNSEEIPLTGNTGGSRGTTYSQYVIHDAAKAFIREHAGSPFFAYLPYTPPHGNFDLPDDDPAWALYRDKPWPEPARRYAAMVTMLDRQVGEILTLLKELGVEDRTLVFFSGDNGGADYFASAAQPRGVHGANRNPLTGVEFRGAKGSLYEGGLRVPFAVRWPGHIAPGQVSTHLGYFPDVLPTILEVAGVARPEDIDGLSLLPELVGAEVAGHAQARHPYLYWEIGGWTALRRENWRVVRSGKDKPWELYDVEADPAESNNLAAREPDRLRQLVALATAAHTPAQEGTFLRTDRHERDRQAKFGRQDDVKPARAGRASEGAGAHSLPTENLLAREGWKVLRFSSESAGNGKRAACAIDGDPGTWWHSRFGADAPMPPHELLLDLGAAHQVRGLVYLARQDLGWNGAAKDAEIFVSDDPERLGEPVASPTFRKVKQAQTIEFPAKRGRYVLFRVFSEHGDGGHASASEIGLIGD